MSIKINADLLIIGDGTHFTNGSVVLEGTKITYVGEQTNAPPAEQTLTTPVVMPGMWDTHAHFVGLKSASLEALPFTDPGVAILRCTWDAQQVLRAGFTSVREVGGLGISLNKAIEEGIILGPRIYASGSLLSTTGGHGDIHNLPLDFVKSLEGTGFSTLCDGVPECLKAVRKQLRQGAEVIKFCASGGVMSKIDDPINQQFSLEEQKAIVDEATRAQVAVAAHCHGAPGIKAALEAGVTTICHGTYLTEELADLMLEKNAILVPTRYVVMKLYENIDTFPLPDYVIEKTKKITDIHEQNIRMAIKKGVKIAAGTDIFVSGPGNIFTWGENAMELKYLVELGMTPMDAIVAATGNAPLTLGPRAPKSGMLKVDYDADVITVTKNPLENIEVLIDHQNISNVIKHGKIITF